MIDRERFEELAAAESCGEATSEERAEFLTALTLDPVLSAEWKKLQEIDAALREAALPPAGELIPMPASVFARLDAARKEALAGRLAAEANAAGAQNVVAFAPGADPGSESPQMRSSTPPLRRSLRTWLALAACVAIFIGLGAAWLTQPGSSGFQASAVLAPRGEITLTRPTVIWDAKPDKSYDVWILPPEGSHVDAPALFTAKGVRPPLDFSELKPAPALAEETRPTTRLEPGTDYRLLVCLADAGRIAGVAVPFRTAASAIKAFPEPSLDAARKLAADGHPSDALTLLSQLPVAEREQPEARTLETELRTRLPKLPVATPTP